jgi:S1-C subfamily serine protease
MDTWQWHARIDADEELPRALGAGFLIDSQCVLTCAHVVTGLTTVRVSLSGGSESLRASVERPTSWTRVDDGGDLALVRLDVPTAVTPARFAKPEGRYWLGELRACGFPDGFEQTGLYVTLRTACDMRLGRDWWQLEVDRDRPECLAWGFSGAAV